MSTPPGALGHGLDSQARGLETCPVQQAIKANGVEQVAGAGDRLDVGVGELLVALALIERQQTEPDRTPATGVELDVDAAEVLEEMVVVLDVPYGSAIELQDALGFRLRQPLGFLERAGQAVLSSPRVAARPGSIWSS